MDTIQIHRYVVLQSHLVIHMGTPMKSTLNVIPGNYPTCLVDWHIMVYLIVMDWIILYHNL